MTEQTICNLELDKRLLTVIGVMYIAFLTSSFMLAFQGNQSMNVGFAIAFGISCFWGARAWAQPDKYRNLLQGLCIAIGLASFAFLLYQFLV